MCVEHGFDAWAEADAKDGTNVDDIMSYICHEMAAARWPIQKPQVPKCMNLIKSNEGRKSLQGAIRHDDASKDRSQDSDSTIKAPPKLVESPTKEVDSRLTASCKVVVVGSDCCGKASFIDKYISETAANHGELGAQSTYKGYW